MTIHSPVDSKIEPSAHSGAVHPQTNGSVASDAAQAETRITAFIAKHRLLLQKLAGDERAMTMKNPYQLLQTPDLRAQQAATVQAARAKALARIERLMLESKQARATGDTERLARLERALDWLDLRVQQTYGY